MTIKAIERRVSIFPGFLGAAVFIAFTAMGDEFMQT
jgi:hypothetical protein